MVVVAVVFLFGQEKACYTLAAKERAVAVVLNYLHLPHRYLILKLLSAKRTEVLQEVLEVSQPFRSRKVPCCCFVSEWKRKTMEKRGRMKESIYDLQMKSQ